MKALVTDDWVVRYVNELKAEFPAVEFVREAAADVEVIIGRVDNEMLERARHVKWIQSLSAGVEWLRNAPALADTDVVVTNARGAHAATIAEHAFGMLVFLTRRFDALYRAQQERVWLQPAPTGTVGLSGLTMGPDRVGSHRPGDRGAGARVRHEGDRRGRP